MSDPFDALRTPIEPADPDARFAARLRARLARHLALPEGVDMPRTAAEPEPVAAPAVRPRSAAGVVPYLAVADARQALSWYAEALGARRRGEPVVMADGRIGHAELALAGGTLMLADEHPEAGVTAPSTGRGASVTLHLEVADVDGAVDLAVGAGARLDRPPADHPYGRNAVVIDPFGHRWLLSGPVPAPVEAPPATGGPGSGDIGYASLWLPDVERAVAFYSAVLGWTYRPGSNPAGRQVEGVAPPLGLWGGQDERTALLCFTVPDVARGAEQVRAAGGQAREPRREPYGVVVDCTDDQGMAFSLVEADSGPGRSGQPPPPRPGELAYFVLGVPDTARARAFYSAVLGWRFTPGRVEDGWNIEGVYPRGGMHGGAAVPVVVPMFAVDDLEAAVERVRAAGGTASDPERMPYGLTADCTDDQGSSFYLGQLA